VALALSFAGFLYSRFRARRVRVSPPPGPPPPSRLSSSGLFFLFTPQKIFSYCNIYLVQWFQFSVHVLIILCILLDHGSEVNLEGGRSRHNTDLHANKTASTSSNPVSIAAEKYVSILGP